MTPVFLRLALLSVFSSTALCATRSDIPLDPSIFVGFPLNFVFSTSVTEQERAERSNFGSRPAIGYLKDHNVAVVVCGDLVNVSPQPNLVWIVMLNYSMIRDGLEQGDVPTEKIDVLQLAAGNPFNAAGVSGGVLGDGNFYIYRNDQLYRFDLDLVDPAGGSNWTFVGTNPFSGDSRFQGNIVVDGNLHLINSEASIFPDPSGFRSLHHMFNHQTMSWQPRALLPVDYNIRTSLGGTIATRIDRTPQRYIYYISNRVQTLFLFEVDIFFNKPVTRNLLRYDNVVNQWTILSLELPIFSDTQYVPVVIRSILYRIIYTFCPQIPFPLPCFDADAGFAGPFETFSTYSNSLGAAYVYTKFDEELGVDVERLRVHGPCTLQSAVTYQDQVRQYSVCIPNQPQAGNPFLTGLFSGQKTPQSVSYEVRLDNFTLSFVPEGVPVPGSSLIGSPIDEDTVLVYPGPFSSRTTTGFFSGTYTQQLLYALKVNGTRQQQAETPAFRGRASLYNLAPVIPDVVQNEADPPLDLYERQIVGRSVVGQILPPTIGSQFPSVEQRSFFFYSGGLSANLPQTFNATDRFYAWSSGFKEDHFELDRLPGSAVGGFGHCLLTYQHPTNLRNFTVVAIGGAYADGPRLGAASFPLFGGNTPQFLQTVAWRVLPGAPLTEPFVGGGCLTVSEKNTSEPFAFLVGGMSVFPSVSLGTRICKVRLVRVREVLQEIFLAEAPFSSVNVPAISRVQQTQQGPQQASPPFGDSVIYVMSGSVSSGNLGTFVPLRTFGCWKYIEATDMWLPVQSMVPLAASSISLFDTDRFVYLISGFGSPPPIFNVDTDVYNFFDSIGTSDVLVYVYDTVEDLWVNRSLPFSTTIPAGGYFGSTSNQMVLPLVPTIPVPVEDFAVSVLLPESSSGFNGRGTPVVSLDLARSPVGESDPPTEIDLGTEGDQRSAYSIRMPFSSNDARPGASIVYVGEEFGPVLGGSVPAPFVCLVGGGTRITCRELDNFPTKRLQSVFNLPVPLYSHASVYVKSSILEGILTYAGFSLQTSTFSTFLFTKFDGTTTELFYTSGVAIYVGSRRDHFGVYLGDNVSLFGCGLFSPESQESLVLQLTASVFKLKLRNDVSISAALDFERVADFLFGPSRFTSVSLNRERTRMYAFPGVTATSRAPIYSGNTLGIFDISSSSSSDWRWSTTGIVTRAPVLSHAFPVELKNVYLDLGDGAKTGNITYSTNTINFGISHRLRLFNYENDTGDSLERFVASRATGPYSFSGSYATSMSFYYGLFGTFPSYQSSAVSYGSVEQPDWCTPGQVARLPTPCQDLTVTDFSNSSAVGIKTLWNENATASLAGYAGRRSFTNGETYVKMDIHNRASPVIEPIFSTTSDDWQVYSSGLPTNSFNPGNLTYYSSSTKLTDRIIVFTNGQEFPFILNPGGSINAVERSTFMVAVDVQKILDGDAANAYTQMPMYPTGLSFTQVREILPPIFCAFPQDSFMYIRTFFQTRSYRLDYDINNLSSGSWTLQGSSPSITDTFFLGNPFACVRQLRRVYVFNADSVMFDATNGLVTPLGGLNIGNVVGGGGNTPFLLGGYVSAVSADESAIYIVLNNDVIYYSVQENYFSYMEVINQRNTMQYNSMSTFLCDGRVLATVPGVNPPTRPIQPFDPGSRMWPIQTFGVLGDPNLGVLVSMPYDAVTPFIPAGMESLDNISWPNMNFQLIDESTDEPKFVVFYSNSFFATFPLNCSLLDPTPATTTPPPPATTGTTGTTGSVTTTTTTTGGTTGQVVSTTGATTGQAVMTTGTTGEVVVTTGTVVTTPPPQPPPTFQPAPISVDRPAITSGEAALIAVFSLLSCIACTVIFFVVYRYSQRIRRRLDEIF